ncbi:MAG: hypothetical protein D6796_14635, partial [Caldilineae bacterium]
MTITEAQVQEIVRRVLAQWSAAPHDAPAAREGETVTIALGADHGGYAMKERLKQFLVAQNYA